jgi:4-hydroxy-4-methyl-2-oxoglutarate aldolase
VIRRTAGARPPELEALAAFDTPTLANALDLVSARPCNIGYARPPVHCLIPQLPPMIGRVVTATIRSESEWPERSVRDEAMLALFDLLATAESPTVVVVQDLDETGPGCLWGEVNATIAHALGCEGVVTDGLVRDLPEVSALGFRYHARGVGVSHSYVRVEAVDVPVTVSGLSVHPGELVHADQHGALSIPEDALSELAHAAADVIAREQRLIGWARSEEFDPGELRRRRLDH